MISVHSKLMFFVAIVLGAGLLGNAYAHKSQVIGEYKIEVGWGKEPAIATKKNKIMITVSKAAASDMDMSQEEHMKMSMKGNGNQQKNLNSLEKSNVPSKSKNNIVSGLAKSLEANITLHGKKTLLKFVEDKKRPGTYYSVYAPEKEGYPTVQVYLKTGKIEGEATYHPEKVKK